MNSSRESNSSGLRRKGRERAGTVRSPPARIEYEGSAPEGVARVARVARCFRLTRRRARVDRAGAGVTRSRCRGFPRCRCGCTRSLRSRRGNVGLRLDRCRGGGSGGARQQGAGAFLSHTIGLVDTVGVVLGAVVHAGRRVAVHRAGGGTTAVLGTLRRRRRVGRRRRGGGRAAVESCDALVPLVHVSADSDVDAERLDPAARLTLVGDAEYQEVPRVRSGVLDDGADVRLGRGHRFRVIVPRGREAILNLGVEDGHESGQAGHGLRRVLVRDRLGEDLVGPLLRRDSLELLEQSGVELHQFRLVLHQCHAHHRRLFGLRADGRVDAVASRRQGRDVDRIAGVAGRGLAGVDLVGDVGQHDLVSNGREAELRRQSDAVDTRGVADECRDVLGHVTDHVAAGDGGTGGDLGLQGLRERSEVCEVLVALQCRDVRHRLVRGVVSHEIQVGLEGRREGGGVVGCGAVADLVDVGHDHVLLVDLRAPSGAGGQSGCRKACQDDHPGDLGEPTRGDPHGVLLVFGVSVRPRTRCGDRRGMRRPGRPASMRRSDERHAGWPT